MVHRLFCLKPLSAVPPVLGFILTNPIPFESALRSAKASKSNFSPPMYNMALTGSERGDVWIFPTGQDLPLPPLLFHPPPDPPPSSYLCTFFSIVQINIRIFKYALCCCNLVRFNFCINYIVFSTPASYHYWELLCSVAQHKCFILGQGKSAMEQKY